jgi:hypothetical protein
MRRLRGLAALDEEEVMSVFTTDTPTYAKVLEARAGHLSMVLR